MSLTTIIIFAAGMGFGLLLAWIAWPSQTGRWQKPARPAKGFILTTAEPTEAMRIAGFESKAWDDLSSAVLEKKGWPYSCKQSSQCVADIFKAMVAARPNGGEI